MALKRKHGSPVCVALNLHLFTFVYLPCGAINIIFVIACIGTGHHSHVAAGVPTESDMMFCINSSLLKGLTASGESTTVQIRRRVSLALTRAHWRHAVYLWRTVGISPSWEHNDAPAASMHVQTQDVFLLFLCMPLITFKCLAEAQRQVQI